MVEICLTVTVQRSDIYIFLIMKEVADLPRSRLVESGVRPSINFLTRIISALSYVNTDISLGDSPHLFLKNDPLNYFRYRNLGNWQFKLLTCSYLVCPSISVQNYRSLMSQYFYRELHVSGLSQYFYRELQISCLF